MSRWRKVPLEECIETIRAGVSLTGENRAPQDGEVGILTLGAVSGGRFDSEACKAVPASAAAALREPLRGGTLLMSRSNTIDLVGSTVHVDEDHPNRFLPDLLWEITLRENSPLTARFLADFLSTPSGRALLQSAAMGTSGSMKKLSMARVRRLEVPAVPRTLQNSWDRLRVSLTRIEEGCDTLLAAKGELKRGLMQELLTGRRRFPEFSNDPWPIRSLHEVVEINPETLRESTAASYQFRYIDLSSVERGRMTSPPRSVRFGDAPSRARRIVRENDVLFATVRPYLQGFMIIEGGDVDLVCSTGFAALRAQTEQDARYVLEFLFSDQLQRQVKAHLVGSSFPALNSKSVESLDIPWPSTGERAAIGRVLRAVSREIALLEDLRDQLELQKRALMQKLLSGEVEIPAGEPEA